MPILAVGSIPGFAVCNDALPPAHNEENALFFFHMIDIVHCWVVGLPPIHVLLYMAPLDDRGVTVSAILI